MLPLLTMLAFAAGTYIVPFDALPKNNTTWRDTGAVTECTLRALTMLGHYRHPVDAAKHVESNIELWYYTIDSSLIDQLPFQCSYVIRLSDEKHVVVCSSLLELSFFESDERLVDRCPSYYERLYTTKVLWSREIVTDRDCIIDEWTGELLDNQRRALYYGQARRYFTH